MRSLARIPTDRAERYGRQLCQHFAEKVEARWSDTTGTAEFGDGAHCRLYAAADHLQLEAHAPDDDGLARVEAIVGGHLERFARRDGLTVHWERQDGNGRTSGDAQPHA